jgi:hypothetical protein
MSNTVQSRAVYDDGVGSALYAGGTFTGAGGVPASRIAKWDGSSWSALGSGTSQEVRALTVHDDGGGAALFAGGIFFTAGGMTVNRIAKWDGASWSALGSGIVGSVEALAVYDGGGSSALYAGGEFTSAPDSGDSCLAKWGTTAPVITCPADIFVQKHGSGAVVDFKVTASDSCDPSPEIVCVPPSGSTFPLGTTLVTCTATDDEGNFSTCTFQVRVGGAAKDTGVVPVPAATSASLPLVADPPRPAARDAGAEKRTPVPTEEPR